MSRPGTKVLVDDRRVNPRGICLGVVQSNLGNECQVEIVEPKKLRGKTFTTGKDNVSYVRAEEIEKIFPRSSKQTQRQLPPMVLAPA